MASRPSPPRPRTPGIESPCGAAWTLASLKAALPADSPLGGPGSALSPLLRPSDSGGSSDDEEVYGLVPRRLAVPPSVPRPRTSPGFTLSADTPSSEEDFASGSDDDGEAARDPREAAAAAAAAEAAAALALAYAVERQRTRRAARRVQARPPSPSPPFSAPLTPLPDARSHPGGGAGR